MASYSALSNNDLYNKAPSIFATAPKSDVSEKYQFIPTLQIVEKLRSEGLFPVRADQTLTRTDGGGSFAKHMIRFRPVAYLESAYGLYEEYPEVVLVNSHDRSSGYQISAGIFRLVCSNGMIARSSDFGTVSVRHSGNIIDDVIEGTFSVIETIPAVLENVERLKSISLDKGEAHEFAKAALQLRYPTDDAGNDTAPIAPESLLGARRWDDREKNDLWTTFNKVQENFIRGGLRGRGTTGKTMRTRAIKSVTEDVRLNKALWSLADGLRKLKETA
jgi:hypothetical protein